MNYASIKRLAKEYKISIRDLIALAPQNDPRPLTAGYVAGFIDGDGCFELGIIRSRAGRRYGWQPRIRFALVQNDAESLLLEFQRFFGCGRIRHHPSITSKHIQRLVIDSRAEIIAKAIPVFDRIPLRVKARDYQIWRTAALLLGPRKRWHDPGVYLQYLELRRMINPRRGRRRKLDIEALRKAVYDVALRDN